MSTLFRLVLASVLNLAFSLGAYSASDAVAVSKESPMAKTLISVYGDVAKEPAGDSTGPGLDFMSALQHSVGLHASAWNAANEAGRIAKQPVVK